MVTTTPQPPTRPPLRARLPSSTFAGAAPSPNSPRTPLLGRTLSSQFNSPGSFRIEQEDHIIYDLGARHLSAGFAGESRPRCIHHFGPEDGRRVGDYRALQPGYQRKGRRKRRKVGGDEEIGNVPEEWGREYELYRSDLRNLDLGLVEDKLEHAIRAIHTNHLQLDSKPRKAVLATSSQLPTPLLEIALKVLFNHYAQPPSVMLLTTPLLACVGAGLRNALVVELGWEECVVTAVGEYREVAVRRSVRAGRRVVWEMGQILEEEVKKQEGGEEGDVSFEYAEEVVQRMASVRSRTDSTPEQETANTIAIPSPNPTSQKHLHISFPNFSLPAERTLFPTTTPSGNDDHDLPIPELAYTTLLSLPLDLRALCVSRIIVTGGVANLPGLKGRLLREIEELIKLRGWDSVRSYGSAGGQRQKVLRERSANIASHHPKQPDPLGHHSDLPPSPSKKPAPQESVPHSARIHDDTHDPPSLKAEREAAKGRIEPIKGVVRGVHTLGAWAGASLVARLGVKGVKEVVREEFLRHGLGGLEYMK